MSRSHAFIFSEAYNMSLADLYRTKKEEDSEFQEDLLIQIAYHLITALSQYSYKSMLRMEMVYFTDVVGTNYFIQN